MHPGAVGRPGFPPQIAAHLIKLACELPDCAGRSLTLWTCAELANTLLRDGLVSYISPQSVQRILQSQKLKPWRVHHWLSPKTPRDQAFTQQTLNIMDLYTRPRAPHEAMFSMDEKTSLQPRPRTAPTKPAQPGGVPVRLEHEYRRVGALNLLAVFNIHSGEVIGLCRPRKRQAEVIELLEEVDRRTSASITLTHVVCDNVRTHSGKQVQEWLRRHPRFRLHFTPVHCSWMNQIEQWFSILQRKRLSAPRFANLQDLEAKILAFIDEWNENSHPFAWTRKSFAKVLRGTPEGAALEAA